VASACRRSLGEDGTLAQAEAGDRARGDEHVSCDGGEESSDGVRAGAGGVFAVRRDVGADAGAEEGSLPEVPEQEA
jgi:hypothetical protein